MVQVGFHLSSFFISESNCLTKLWSGLCNCFSYVGSFEISIKFCHLSPPPPPPPPPPSSTSSSLYRYVRLLLRDTVQTKLNDKEK